MYKSIKIYTRTSCQVGIYRTTSSLVKHKYALSFFRSQAETTMFDQEMFRLALIFEGLDGV